MLEKNQRFKSLLYVLTDAALLFIGFLLANYIRFNYVRYFEPGGAGPALAVARDPRNIIAGLATSLVLVLIYWVAGIYSTTRLRGLAERCTKIAVINAAGLLIFIGALYLMHLDDYSRIVLALFYILGTAGVVIERMILRWVDRARRRKGLGLRHILLVGGGKSAALYLRALEHNPYYGFVVDGYLAGIEEPGLGVRYMGSYDALSARLDEIAVDEVVVALEADEIELLPHVFAACDKNGVRITMVPFYSDYLPARPTIDVLDECKLINVRQTPFDNLLNAAVKRGLDIIGSLILIILTSPVMLVTAIGVKLSSPGPVIFKQERVGKDKKPFYMYKFRSMRVNARENTGWSRNEDDRKTWLSGSVCVLIASIVLRVLATKNIFETNATWQGPTVNSIVTWALICACISIVTMVCVYLFGGRKQKGITLEQYGIAAKPVSVAAAFCVALLVSVIAYACLFAVDAIFKTDFRIWTFAFKTFEASAIPAAVKYMPFFFVYYFVSGAAAISNTSSEKLQGGWGYLLAALTNMGGILLWLVLQYGTLFRTGVAFYPGQALGGILLFALVPSLAIASCLAKYLYKKTGSVYVAAFLNTILMTMMTVANTAIYFQA